ncbi:MAG: hypothetical protein K8R69_12460 [Deltaproteobacteria bacterium]|nr:hypothetical protein [Deltaproteobacteria bacterium]
MTPPKVDKVDIQALDTLYLENLLGMDVNEVAKRFTGSDLVVDTKTGEIKTTDGKTVTTLEQEAAWVKTIHDANTNGDKFLDVAEVKKLLGTTDQTAAIDPQKFLDSINSLMKGRYEPLSKSMKGWKAELAFKPTLDALDLYNKGIYSEGIRHANATLDANALLTKTPVNILGFIPGLVRRTWSNKPVLMGDQAAMTTAKNNYNERTAALGKLNEVIAKGVAANESWAIEGKMDEALKKLDPKTAALLNDQLATTQLHTIITIEDPKDRYQKMTDFAKKDRPGFLGFGTGNTSAGWFNTDDLWNLSGHRYNTFFSRTVLRFLATKAASGDAASDDALHKDARVTLSDMNGDGGGFNNLAAAAMAESKFNILAGGKWGEAALAAEKEAETLGLAGKSANNGRFYRLLDKWDAATGRFKEWIFKGVPLSAEQKAMAESMGKMGSKGMDKLTRGVVLLGIAQYADTKLSPHYNPFEYGLTDVSREADFERYDDPTKPAIPVPKK